ncbi:MAG: pyrimidine utilization protein D [Sphingomonas sp.]|jgi:aminoacrylate hydrolase|uniref:pyrimidine utilization protein D n=1 Tax=Sphingomonas sp. TaxID=28214 RepID=UPI00356231EC
MQAAGLWYEWHGPEHGEVVILSPGMGGSAGYWLPNLAALAADYRVLLYDHRGTGRSDRTLPDDLTIASMAADVLALLEEIGVERAHFIGHALGGLIGLELARIFPGIGKIVVINGWASLDPHFARCFETRLELLHRSGPAAYVRAQSFFLYPANWISENIAQLDAEGAHQLAHFPPVETLEKRIGAARMFELPADVAADILVLVSEDDMLVPSHCARQLADRLPRAMLATMAWGGHACNVTDPATFNSLALEFLGS